MNISYDKKKFDVVYYHKQMHFKVCSFNIKFIYEKKINPDTIILFSRYGCFAVFSLY